MNFNWNGLCEQAIIFSLVEATMIKQRSKSRWHELDSYCAHVPVCSPFPFQQCQQFSKSVNRLYSGSEFPYSEVPPQSWIGWGGGPWKTPPVFSIYLPPTLHSTATLSKTSNEVCLFTIAQRKSTCVTMQFTVWKPFAVQACHTPGSRFNSIH